MSDAVEIEAGDVGHIGKIGEVDPEALPYGNDAGEIKGPDPDKWGTVAERVQGGANLDPSDGIGTYVVDTVGMPDENLDQYIIKGPDPEQHP